MSVHSAGFYSHRQSAMGLTRPERFINSLAVGVALGVAEYLADGLAAGILTSALAFLVEFAVFGVTMR
jgi:hypothetical protein